MKTRTLNLRRETLTELTTGELGSVAGASGLPCEATKNACLDLTNLVCLPTQGCTGYYPSIFDPCQ